MKKIKVECLECYKNKKGIGHYRIIPIAWINLYYGNVNNFIESEIGTCFEATSYKIIKSNDYQDKYSKYLNEDNNRILKCIEAIKNNDITNKNQVINYLESQLV